MSLNYLSDVGEADYIRHDAHAGNENLSSFPQERWELVHQSRDEAFQRTELQRRTEKLQIKGIPELCSEVTLQYQQYILLRDEFALKQ